MKVYKRNRSVVEYRVSFELVAFKAHVGNQVHFQQVLENPSLELLNKVNVEYRGLGIIHEQVLTEAMVIDAMVERERVEEEGKRPREMGELNLCLKGKQEKCNLPRRLLYFAENAPVLLHSSYGCAPGNVISQLFPSRVGVYFPSFES